jgi:hypothetical protein
MFSIDSSRFHHQLFALIQQCCHPRQIRNHVPAVSHQQQLLRIGRETEICGWLSLWKAINPFGEVPQARPTGERQALVILNSRNQLVVKLESRRCEETGDEILELLKVAAVVDLPAISLGDQGADHVPRKLLGRYIGAALRNRVDPGINDECRAFVLD